MAFHLAGDRIGRAQFLLDQAAHLLLQRRAGPCRLEVARLLRRLLGKLDDGVDHRLEVLVAEHHGAEHHLLGQLLGFRFHHQNGVRGAGDDEIELALRHLVDLRIEHIFVVDEADTGGPDRPHERRAGEGERRRGGDHGDDVGIILQIVRQRGHDHLGVAAVALGEQRPDRPVDQAGDQCLLFGRAAFALEISAGNAAGGIELFLVVTGERQEVDAFLRLLGRDHGGDHGGLAICGNDGAVGLARYSSGLQDELPPAPIESNSMNVEHCDCLSRFSRRGESHEQDGEKLRRATAIRATASSDPAMAFEPSMYVAGSHPVPFSAASSLPVQTANALHPPNKRER